MPFARLIAHGAGPEHRFIRKGYWKARVTKAAPTQSPTRNTAHFGMTALYTSASNSARFPRCEPNAPNLPDGQNHDPERPCH